MAGSVNKVILVGNLGADQEIRRTQDGRPIANLRLATSAQNSWNTRKHADNKAGFKGVSPEGRRFVAAIMVKGVKHRLGSFDTADAAHRAYCAAAERLHGEFARVA